MLHIYLISWDEWYWFIAENPTEAEQLFQDWLVETFGEDEGPALLSEPTEKEPDNGLLAVIVEGTPQEPTPWVLARAGRRNIEKFRKEMDEGHLARAKIKACAQWAQEHGKGFFASTG